MVGLVVLVLLTTGAKYCWRKVTGRRRWLEEAGGGWRRLMRSTTLGSTQVTSRMNLLFNCIFVHYNIMVAVPP